MKLRWSLYNSEVLNDDNTLVFLTNSFTEKVYSFSIKAKQQIDITLQRITEIKDEEMKKKIAELVVDGFIVSKSREEEALERKALIEQENENSDAGVVYFMPSYLCNFRCSYCIIGTAVDKVQQNIMSEYDVKRSAEWIVNFANEKKILKLLIVLFGGEPTMTYKEHLMLMKELNKSDLDIQYCMVTNGYLLSDQLLEQFIEQKLTMVQITLDGPSEFHDKRRKLASGAGTYDIIVKNVLNATNKNIKIVIRVNIDEQNCNEIKKMYDELYRLGLNKAVATQIACVDSSDYSKITGYSEKVLSQLQDIYSYVYAKNFEIARWNKACSIFHKMYLTINYNGDLYCCSSFVGNEKYKIGNIRTGVTSLYYKNYNQEFDNKCYYCEFLGICYGGCEMSRQFSNQISSDDAECNFVALNRIILKSRVLAKYDTVNMKKNRFLGKLMVK